MRIVHLVAGAGGMYCGSCLHGNALVAALRGLGCDAVLLPPRCLPSTVYCLPSTAYRLLRTVYRSPYTNA